MSSRIAVFLVVLLVSLPSFAVQNWNMRLVYGSGISGEVLPCG